MKLLALASAVSALPAVGLGMTLTFSPLNSAPGMVYGSFLNPNDWRNSDGERGFVGGPDDDLIIPASSYLVPMFVYTDNAGAGGFSVRSIRVEDAFNRGVTIGPEFQTPGVANLVQTVNFEHLSGTLTLRSPLIVSNTFALSGRLFVESSVNSFDTLVGSGSMTIRNGGRLVVTSAELEGGQVSILGERSTFTAGSLSFLNRSGTGLNMAVPTSVDGGSLVSADNLDFFGYRGGTMVRLADGGSGNAANPDTNLNLTNAFLSVLLGESVGFQLNRESELQVFGTISATATAEGHLQLFSIAEGSTATVNRVEIMDVDRDNVSLGTVDGAGSTLTINEIVGYVSDKHNRTFLRAASGSEVEIGSIDLTTVGNGPTGPLMVADGGRIRLNGGSISEVRGVLFDALNSGSILANNVGHFNQADLVMLARGGGAIDLVGGQYSSQNTTSIAAIGTSSRIGSANTEIAGRTVDVSVTGGASWAQTDPDAFVGTALQATQNINVLFENAGFRGTSFDMRAPSVSATFRDTAFEQAGLEVWGNSNVRFERVNGTSLGLAFTGNSGNTATVTMTDSTIRARNLGLGIQFSSQGPTPISASMSISGSNFAADALFLGTSTNFSTIGRGSLVLDGNSVAGTFRASVGAHKTPGLAAAVGGQGDLTVRGGSRLSVGSYVDPISGELVQPNQGTSLGILTLGPTSSLNVSGGGSVFIGTVFSAGSMVFTPDRVTVASGGVLNGSGRINGVAVGTPSAYVVNTGGSIEPGLSAGRLTIDGTYEQTSGQVVLEVGGADLGRYDQLAATGGFTFRGGRIVVRLIDGYLGVGDVGRSFRFFDGPTFDWSGFDFSSGIVDETGMGWTFGLDGTATFAQAVPEPGSLVAVGVGLAWLLRRRRGSKRSTG